ncbi:MAG: hypothetical protein VBE63_17550 [Lamprobacter sp.]|uniref:hypothetical protein n=1 Tax=Lamprobacter sp. TaxID=3100796 RepID=UPI002B257047|nr:hypothetical protein [Lamprobacter sp.]MEA3641723.1 hypothetical protein [Lamprobacter sp.]
MKKHNLCLIFLFEILAAVQFLPLTAFGHETRSLTPSELKEIYSAAGLTERNGKIFDACDRPTKPEIEVKDLNTDGTPEVFVHVPSLCYGHSGNLSLLIKDKKGNWKDNFGFTGVYRILDTKSMGYPDIEIGGPGTCFPVWRWNGKAYAIHKRCDRR